MSSSSSFFLHSKWSSIRVWSSIRSLFWRFFWMSYSRSANQMLPAVVQFQWVNEVVLCHCECGGTRDTSACMEDVFSVTPSGCCMYFRKWITLGHMVNLESGSKWWTEFTNLNQHHLFISSICMSCHVKCLFPTVVHYFYEFCIVNFNAMSTELSSAKLIVSSFTML